MEASTITSNDTARLLGIIIDHKRSFRQQAAASIAKTQSLRPDLQRLAFSRGASMNTFHKLITSLLSPILTLGSAVWWTGTAHLIDSLNPTYLRFARLITRLPTHTRSEKLLDAAGLPPLKLLLNMKSRNNGIRLLRAENNHPSKVMLSSTPPLSEGTGLGRIKSLLVQIVPAGTRSDKDQGPSALLPSADINIRPGSKRMVADGH